MDKTPKIETDFVAQIEAARKRLRMGTDATPWQVMCANAEVERASDESVDFWVRALLGRRDA